MKKGFTLMEILVAISIIAILTAIGIVSYGSVNRRSRDTKRKSDVEQIRSAIEMYRTDNGYYPSTGAGSWTDMSNLSADLVATYMPSIPADPKDPDYVYRYKATDVSGGSYYGYCVSAYLEAETPASNSCTPDASQTPAHNFGVKSP
ncbi:type II secretion system protein GspG [Candidatus Gottesmanbacteria bacterium]|nr:type II secretion system protein GspG [Candidatus Gottesmanbacteria bacterium]